MQTEIAAQRREEELAAISAMQQTAATATATAQTAAAETTQAQAKAQNPYVDVQVGDIIEFGSYEQDNDLSNGPEPIEWRVLEVSDGSALIVSEYALDARAYNKGWASVTWAECTLRGWLNGEFYATAFNEEEKGRIAIVGDSGGGKSTIAKLIAGFWNTCDGEILIGKNNLNDMLLKQNMELVAYVSQENFLFNKAVLENLKMAKEDASMDIYTESQGNRGGLK